MAIPFVYELRTLMDWIWTETSMTVFDWIKMEDIFSQIFQLKVYLAHNFAVSKDKNPAANEIFVFSVLPTSRMQVSTSKQSKNSCQNEIFMGCRWIDWFVHHYLVSISVILPR